MFGSGLVWVLVLWGKLPVGYFKDQQACVDAVKKIVAVSEAEDVSANPFELKPKTDGIKLAVRPAPLSSYCVPVEKPLKD